jgi:hypothetical protein
MQWFNDIWLAVSSSICFFGVNYSWVSSVRNYIWCEKQKFVVSGVAINFPLAENVALPHKY